MKPAPSLLELQRAMLAGLGHGDLEAAAGEILADGIEAAARLSIYRNTSISTLVNALRLTYPAVRKLVGEEFFEGAAHAFADARPAASAWLDEYGRGFDSFLAAFPPALSLPYLPCVAALEWSVSRALHAPDATGLDLARLASVSAGDSRRLRLVAHPSVGLVRADAPVDRIWHAVLDEDDDAMRAIDLADGPVHLLVERRDSAVRVERLSERSWRLVAALYDGAPLQAALDRAGDDAPERLLAEHLAAGRFAGFDLAHTLND
jgi:hypothetical protein